MNKNYPWIVVGLLCVVGCLNYLDRMMITTMRGSIMESMPMTEAQFGLLTSVFLWVYGILSPFAGFLADRFSRSKVIMWSLLVWSTVTWLTSYVSTFEQLLFTRALMGISEACYMPAAFALIVDYHRGPTRSLATGIHTAGILVGQSLGFIGGMLAESRSWNYAFSVMGVIGIGYSGVLLFLLKDSPVQDGPVPAAVQAETKVGFADAILHLFGRGSFIRILVTWSLLGIVAWMIIGWLPTFYKEQFNLSQSMAGVYATGYFHTIKFVAVLVGGVLVDRWSRTNPNARILFPALGLCIAAPGILLASSTSLLVVAVSGFAVYALFRPLVDANIMPILCMIIDKRYLATGYGVLNMFSCIIGGAGLYAGGILRDADINLGNMFQLAAGVLLICALLLYSIRSRSVSKVTENLNSKHS
jgi:MFS family permease